MQYLEKPLINKNEITIIIDSNLDLDLSTYLYGSFGEVTRNFDTTKTRYCVYLKNHLTNIVYLINKMFFNPRKILQNENGDVKIIEKDSTDTLILNDINIKNLEV